MKRLIINADDFGWNEGVVKGIIDLYEEGLVSSTSCLTNMPSWPLAAEYLRQNPEFGAGVHLVFNEGFPVLPREQVTALLNNSGRFLTDQQIMWSLKPGTTKQLRNELNSQIERFIRDVGRLPDHLDNHCSISYIRPDRFKITLDLAKKYNLPIRAPFGDDLETQVSLFSELNNIPAWQILFLGKHYRRKVDQAGIHRPNAFIQQFSIAGSNSPDNLLSILDNLKDGWVSELLVHPGYDGNWREVDLKSLLDPQIRERLAKPDIELINFGVLACSEKQ